MRSLDNFIQQFRQNGKKITPQRRAIIELLVENSSHPTVDDIYQRVLIEMPEVSRTTIYNVMHEMSSMGAITEVNDLSGGGLRFDANTSSHHHLYCTYCHTIMDTDVLIQGLELTPEESDGFKVKRPQVTFYGICPVCQKNVGDNESIDEE